MTEIARTVPRARRRRRWRGRALSYAGLVAAAAFALTPILWALSTSLKAESQVLSDQSWWPAEITWENYRLVFFESKIPLYIGNSILVAGLTIVATVVVSIFGAYAAARFRFRGRTVSLFFVLTTSMIPGIAILVPLYFLAVALGLYDSFLLMVIIYTAWQIPTVVWMLKGFFEAIPSSIEEAGRIDGASHLRIMVQLIFPLITPGITAAAIIAFVSVWNDFLIAATMISDNDKRLVSVGLYNYLSQYGIVWGQLTAAVMVTLIPVIVLFVAMERRIVAGLANGATKG